MTTITTPITPTRSWRSIVRNAQTFLPRNLHEARLDAQQWVRQRTGTPHEHEFRALEDLLYPGSHCVDVGANRGQSIDSLRTLDLPGLQITAFEPQAALAYRLMFRYPSVRVHKFALGAGPDQATLYTPSYRGYRFDGLASCDEAAAVGWFSYSIWPYDPELVTVEQEKVYVAALDDFTLTPVDFIKFDVQGMELAALHGAEGLLRRDKPLLMIEAPDAATIAWLEALGYVMYHADGYALVAPGDRWAINVFFRHEG